MATYAEALEALGKIEGGADLTEAVKSEFAKKNSEAAGLRKRLKPLEERVRKIAGVEESDDLEEALATIETASKAGAKGGKPDDRVATLEKTVADLKKSNEIEKAKATAAIVGNDLKSALVDAKGKRPDDLMKLLLDRVKVEGDKRTFLQEDGTEVDIKTGVKAWATTRPEFFESEQQPGPGGSGTRNQTPPGGATQNAPAPLAQLEAAFAGTK